MKRIYAAFLTMVLIISTQMVTNAQTSELTAQMLGLPQELFDGVKNLVTTTDHTGGFTAKSTYTKLPASEWKVIQDKYKLDLKEARSKGLPLPKVPSQYYWKTSFVQSSSDKPFGTYVLNYVHDMIWEFGYEYEGFQNGKYTLHKFHGDYLAADGNVYSNFDSYFYIYQLDGKWVIGGDNELPKHIYAVPDPANTVTLANGTKHTPNKLVQYTKEEVAASLGWTVAQLDKFDLDYKVCEVRNPSTHITSMFPRYSSDGSQIFTYISGKRSDLVNFKGLISSNGKTLSDYDIEIIALNDCPIPEVKSSDTDWTGNFGECLSRWYETEQEAAAFTYQYDYSKDFAVQVFAIEISSSNGSPNGHYDRWHCYYDKKNGRVMQSPSDK